MKLKPITILAYNQGPISLSNTAEEVYVWHTSAQAWRQISQHWPVSTAGHMVFQGMITGGDLESKCKGIVTSHVRVNREPGYKLGTFARTEQKIIYSGAKMVREKWFKWTDFGGNTCH